MLVVLPETSEALAQMVAERLCTRLQKIVIFDDMRTPMPHLTGSLGVACLDGSMTELQLVAAADAALYRAKEAGRNRCRCSCLRSRRKATTAIN
jgi:diguanylate cyclase (GGDEF)-like protein